MHCSPCFGRVFLIITFSSTEASTEDAILTNPVLTQMGLQGHGGAQGMIFSAAVSRSTKAMKLANAQQAVKAAASAGSSSSSDGEK